TRKPPPLARIERRERMRRGGESQAPGRADSTHLGVATVVEMTTLDLRKLRLRSGDQHRDEQEIELQPFELGGQRSLPVRGTVPAELMITRASTGTVFELRFDARLHGPCFRCLEDAVLEVTVSARECQPGSPGDDEELRTIYVEDDKLDLSAWARDAVALELPDKILCRPDCAGLCAECGKNLNDEPHDHGEPEPDSRWAALVELNENF